MPLLSDFTRCRQNKWIVRRKERMHTDKMRRKSMLQGESILQVVFEKIAYFFDFDDTLAGIKRRPEEVEVPINIKQVLCKLSSPTSGAQALISGRSITELDALSVLLKGPVAAVHGAERRNAHGMLYYTILSESLLVLLKKELKQAIIIFEGCCVEEKGIAFTLYYREREQYRGKIMALAHHFAERYPQLMLQFGKCVVELKSAGVDKESAILKFMQEAPFAGRIPLFVGDSLIDETGFRQVNALEGISVKVGFGNTIARYYLKDVSQVHQWVKTLVKQNKNRSIKTINSVREVV